MDIQLLIQLMIKFFILMSVGYLLYRIKIMDSDFNKKLTNFVLKVSMPCMIVSSVFSSPAERDLSKVLFVFLIAIIMYAILPAIGMLIAKIIGCKVENRGIYVFMTIFTNVGFMGFPVIESIIGSEALFYTAIFNMIFNIMLFTVGVKAINYPEKSGHKTDIMKILLHPGVLSAVIAIVIYFLRIELPSFIQGPISQIGDLTPTLAMILMGASLAKVPIKNVFNEPRIYAFIAVKQIALPLLSWVVIKNLINDSMIQLITLTMISLPIANSVVMFTIEYDKNEELAAKNVFLSTVASIVLLPLVLYLTYLR